MVLDGERNGLPDSKATALMPISRGSRREAHVGFAIQGGPPYDYVLTTSDSEFLDVLRLGGLHLSLKGPGFRPFWDIQSR
jgi:hypothetical protein